MRNTEKVKVVKNSFGEGILLLVQKYSPACHNGAVWW
jgi:hypothetical protein